MNPDLMKDFLLETFPNPERKGCPDDKTLQALAEDKPSADDAARLHVGSCSECYAEYRHFRLDWEEAQTAGNANPENVAEDVRITPSSAEAVRPARRFMAVPMALAASLIVMCMAGYVAFRHRQQATTQDVQTASVNPVNATVDLLDSGTVRGAGDDTTPLRQVSLPSSVVHLAIVLPRFSETGRYIVNVSKDKSGRQIIASGAGDATEKDHEKVVVDVMLDLRSAKTGAYFLATVRGTDNGTYYYPLKIN